MTRCSTDKFSLLSLYNFQYSFYLFHILYKVWSNVSVLFNLFRSTLSIGFLSYIFHSSVGRLGQHKVIFILCVQLYIVNLYTKSGINVGTYELYLAGFNLRKVFQRLIKRALVFSLRWRTNNCLVSYILKSDFFVQY